MRIHNRTKITIAVTTLCLAVGFVLTQFVIAQAPAPQGGRGTMTGQRGGGMMGADPRAKTLTYHFKEADEDMQYCLFVSSKVSKDKKAPLIVTLHGMGAGPTIMVSKAAVDLAEEGGYILVSPMGYNTTGWYGSMAGGMSGMRGMRGAPEGRGVGDGRSGAAAPGGGRSGAAMPGGGANAELTATRDKTGKPSTGAAGKWLIKDGSNEIKLEIKAEGSKFTGTIDNSQVPGAVELKDGKIEGDKISFNYVRQMNGQDTKISWTGTLSGDEMKLKREIAGGGGGMRAAGDGRSGPGMMGGTPGGGDSSGKDTNALSEKDVMNVLDIVFKEYKIDERRVYLMGHSMGGAGTLHLGTKYPDKWAALAAAAPAAFTSPDVLKSLVGKGVPVLIMRGDQDTLIGANVTKPWVDKLKELNIFYEYKEIPGVEHGGIINACLPTVYEFFAKHSKK
jgi:poly(3-hydroxybutyrate) depolymerase